MGLGIGMGLDEGLGIGMGLDEGLGIGIGVRAGSGYAILFEKHPPLTQKSGKLHVPSWKKTN